MKAFKVKNTITIVFNTNEVLTDIPASKENWDYIVQNKENDIKVYNHFNPNNSFIDKNLINKSKLLVLEDDFVYMPSVSNISMPKDIILKILEAEESSDKTQLVKWVNFWTFVSMNPNEGVRDNIFWFLNKWNIQITDSGLIRAYRNVDIKEESQYSTAFVKSIINRYYTEKYINNMNPDEIKDEKGISLSTYYNEIVNDGKGSPIYTDRHTGTFRIKLGQPVRMPREEVDEDSTVSCSRGLHLSGAEWLQKKYYGEVGLECLVNPANVCAVPPLNNYGKLRCCEYYPVAVVDYDEEGKLITPPISLYNDVAYLKQLQFEGQINNKEGIHYTNVRTTRDNIYTTILDRLNK